MIVDEVGELTLWVGFNSQRYKNNLKHQWQQSKRTKEERKNKKKKLRLEACAAVWHKSSGRELDEI